MAYKIFIIPIHNIEAAEESLNGFLLNHTVLSVDRRWVDQGSNSFWSFCIDYLDPKIGGGKRSRQQSERSKVDYREVLNDADFALFSKLRDLRKQVAGAEGIPVYTVFNNEQLARMVQDEAKTKADLEAIVGVGNARIEKYGERFLEFLAQQSTDNDEKNREPV